MFCEVVRLHRQRLALTQEDLAERSGVSIRGIRKIEGGKVGRPRPATVRLLAEAFGLTGAERDAFVRSATGECAAFSAAVAVEQVPRQLPAPVPAFTGRTAELAALDGLIAGPEGDLEPAARDATIVAIDGMAGAGKTALAVQWAHRVAEHFPGGQLFIDLRGAVGGAPPVDPADALDRLLQDVGIPGSRIPATLDDRAALWRSRLAGRRVLVLLDNADSAHQVRALLPGTPPCLTVVTSRRRLGGLDTTRTISLDVLPVSDAVALLARVAGRVGMAAGQADDATTELAELCGRLPLALRIAGGRLRAHTSWSPADLADRLRARGRRLAELADESRSVVSALDVSYAQLAPGPRRLYRLLGLHPGVDTDPHAAAAMAGTALPRAELDLDELHRAHLVQEPAPLRYGFHDLIRSHAAGTAARDETEPDQAAAVGRLLDHLGRTASAAADVAYPDGRGARPASGSGGQPVPHLTDPERAAAWLDAELPNLLATAAHAAQHGWPGYAIHLSAILPQHLHTRGHYGDLEALRRAALVAALDTGDRVAEADARNGLGWAYWLRGRFEESAVQFVPALRAARAAVHGPGETEALVGLGWSRQRQGRYEVATVHFTKALERARAAGHRRREMAALIGIGWAYWLHGNHRRSLVEFTAALRIARSTNDRHGELDARIAAANAERMLGRYDAAADAFASALTSARSAGHQHGQLHALLGLGNVCRMRGRYPRALDHFIHAGEIAHATGHHDGELDALTGQAHAHRRRSQHDLAAERYQRALRLATGPGDEQWRFEAEQGLGRLHHALGELDPASRRHRAALDLATDLRRPVEQARAHDGLAHVHHSLGQQARALRHWRSALNLLDGAGAEYTADEDLTTEILRARVG